MVQSCFKFQSASSKDCSLASLTTLTNSCVLRQTVIQTWMLKWEGGRLLGTMERAAWWDVKGDLRENAGGENRLWGGSENVNENN